MSSDDLKKKRTISLFKLRADVQPVLDEVEKDGTTFTLMDGGVAIARLEPIPPTSSALMGKRDLGVKARARITGDLRKSVEREWMPRPEAERTSGASKSRPVKGRAS